MDEGHNHCYHFAQSKNLEYTPLKDFCENKKISFPESSNFEGLLYNPRNSLLIPIEHTTASQNKADFLLNKIRAGVKIKTFPPIHTSSYIAEAHNAIQKKHEKSEGYSNCVLHLEKHGISCSKRGILLLERFVPYNNPLYDQENFNEESDLLHESVLCERNERSLSFFEEIYHCASFLKEMEGTLCIKKIF